MDKKGIILVIGLGLVVLGVTPGLLAEGSWSEKNTGLEFVKVDGGCYQMGQVEAETHELERMRLVFDSEITFGDEKPRHEVCVDDFNIGRHEVTVAAFRAFVLATGYQTDAEKNGGCWEYPIPRYRWQVNAELNWQNPGFKQKDNEPVVCVSWNDSKAFADWLTVNGSGRKFRLASEAEWEFAARDRGNDRKFAAASDELNEVGWYAKNSPRRTSPIGTKKAGALGIYDMSGNVWEWVGDAYSREYYGQSGGKNPTGPNAGPFRVVRGGGWNSHLWNCRAAKRDRALPSHRDINQGFRLVFTE